MRFEYLVINTGGMPISQRNLNEFGADGWALVTVAFDTAYFMREKAEPKEPKSTVTKKGKR